ncbi:MAG: M3 family oligoendopeptidase [Candidatus Andersenbacteria bacterium]|nr:M3 family oligoendopeptidase [Candidatus Andersenbacteria bacterium]MBI3251153.1 M3 family oligoendopeptidase [Candidatus Andersenbacteria bacterium]
MAEKIPQWDLSDLYKGINDPAIARDQARLKKEAQAFHKKYARGISENTSPKEITSAIKEYEKILRDIDKIQIFSRLLFATKTNDKIVAARMQGIDEWAATVRSLLLFFSLCIGSLPASKLKDLMKAPSLASYRHWLQRLVDMNQYRLSEKEEALLLETSLTGRDAFTRLYEQEDAKRTYPFKSSGHTHVLNESEILSKFYDPKRSVRQQASESLNHALVQDVDRTAFMYNMIGQDVILDTRRRGFARPEDARHVGNEVSTKAVDVLISQVTANYKIVHDYYKFKKRLLKLPALYEYDRYAPVAATSKKYTFAQAKNIVLTAFGEFSPTFREVAELFFDNNWVDARPGAGKQGGAFCVYVTPDLHPYVLMNFNGTINDVMTLAHELGHAIHAYIARKNSYLQFDCSLTIAEIASIFAEMIVFNAVKETLSPKERFALYAVKVEGIIASVFRQAAFFEFERVFFEKRSQGELTPQDLGEIWQGTFKKMYGPSIRQSPGSELQWGMIPHFFQWPFYVYSYAFGDLLTRSLFAQYKKDPTTFVPAYLKMLAFGGSKSPQDLLSEFGVNIEKAAFWRGGIKEIETLVTEAKKLA